MAQHWPASLVVFDLLITVVCLDWCILKNIFFKWIFFASDILIIATIQILAKCGIYFTNKLRQRKRPYNVRGSAAEDLWYFVFTISEMYL